MVNMTYAFWGNDVERVGVRVAKVSSCERRLRKRGDEKEGEGGAWTEHEEELGRKKPVLSFQEARRGAGGRRSLL